MLAKAGAGALLIIAGVASFAMLLIGYGQSRAQGQQQSNAKTVTYLDQGWTEAEKQWWYTASQGSRLLPLSWMLALEQKGSAAKFLSAANIKGFGYLTGTAGNGLPLGFAVDEGPAPDNSPQPWVGMTCAACHTGEFTHNNRRVRIDGAPALVDFQGLMESMLASLVATRVDDQKLNRFVNAILGASASANDRTKLIGDLGVQIS